MLGLDLVSGCRVCVGHTGVHPLDACGYFFVFYKFQRLPVAVEVVHYTGGRFEVGESPVIDELVQLLAGGLWSCGV